jgi:diadenosine tetraphosphatase ApaH/serine/threonine PP2A family protein phosphatase
MGASDRAAHEQLTTRHLEWLATLPATQTLEDQIFLCHGSPRSDLEYLLEDIRDDSVHLSHTDQILPRLNGVNASLILCGHTYIPRTVLLPGGAWVVNVDLIALDYDWHSDAYALRPIA